MTRYSVDASDKIIEVDGNWEAFALENDAPPDVLSANILFRSFWDFVSGDALRHAYRRIMSTVRAGQSLDFDLRCDSPDLRRYLKLRITPAAEGGIDFVTETIRTEPRHSQRVFDANSQRSDDVIVACSWCNKLRTGENCWREVEEAVSHLALFDTDAIPALSHGMCDDCYASVLDKVESG